MIAMPTTTDQEAVLKDLIPDLTPMLDILFILLVFFMLAVGQVFQSLELTLPQSTAEAMVPAQTEDTVVLALGNSDDSYAINDKQITGLAAFKAEVLASLKHRPEQTVVLAGDRSLPLERLLTVLTFLNDHGIQTANILMQTGDTP